MGPIRIADDLWTILALETQAMLWYCMERCIYLTADSDRMWTYNPTSGSHTLNTPIYGGYHLLYMPYIKQVSLKISSHLFVIPK